MPRSGTLLALLLMIVYVLAGCGEEEQQLPGQATAPPQPVLGQRAQDEDAPISLGFPSFATKNTTRIGGADPIADAAGVALAVHPSRSLQTRPAAVTLVDVENWQAAISAAQLAADPIGAPVLFSDGDDIPPATESALRELQPAGAPSARNAQVFRIATPAQPERLRATNIEGSTPAAIAQAIDSLHTSAAGGASRTVIVASSEDPEYAMPAAGWAAKTGDAVLWTDRASVPEETLEVIRSRKNPRIYVLGPERVVSKAAVTQLERLGAVTRIEGENAIRTAIAFARFSDRGFGWNVVDPGHGMVFASLRRPADAAAAAPLSSTGSYGPLLLLDVPTALPQVVQDYLLDIQPGYETDPARGVYNHGWLIGDETAITVDVQARIDALLEIEPVDTSS